MAIVEESRILLDVVETFSFYDHDLTIYQLGGVIILCKNINPVDKGRALMKAFVASHVDHLKISKTKYICAKRKD